MVLMTFEAVIILHTIGMALMTLQATETFPVAGMALVAFQFCMSRWHTLHLVTRFWMTAETYATQIFY